MGVRSSGALRWSSGFLLCTPDGTPGSAQHGLCINRTWGISKTPRSSHAVRHRPCSRHPAAGGCFTLAKLQIILVESPGPRLSSNLTWCREPAELQGQGCRGPAICPRLCGPSGRALASSPDRPGCAAEWAQAVPVSHVGQAGALQRSLRSAGWLLVGGPGLSVSPFSVDFGSSMSGMASFFPLHECP